MTHAVDQTGAVAGFSAHDAADEIRHGALVVRIGDFALEQLQLLYDLMVRAAVPEAL